MANPYSDKDGFPQFNDIDIHAIPKTIEHILNENRNKIKILLQQPTFTWDNLVVLLEDLNDQLNQAFSPIRHLNSVMNTQELTKAYQACLPKLSEYSTELGQNETLYQAYKQLANSKAYNDLNIAQQKVITNALRDFKLSGIGLPDDKKQQFKQNEQTLSKLTNDFNQNVLDATQAWHFHTENLEDLAGLPTSALKQAEQAAKNQNKTGWLVTLDFPAYYAVMTYANDRALRERFYHANCTRASALSPSQPQFDNAHNIANILKLRHEQALLLGFNHYAELSLATKMAPSVSAVLDFLYELGHQSKRVAEQEFNTLKAFAHEQGFNNELMPWDISYYSEKLSEKLFSISQEALRQYFPEDKVLPGLFKITAALFGIKITQQETPHAWHKDVKFFALADSDNQIIGYCYMDLYARSNKQGGAWMDEYRIRKQWHDEPTQLPIAYLTCNFSGPVNNNPACFTHNEVVTLFHEFGHTLHHLLSKVNYPPISGINGVEWDAVELPSQLLENWCWEAESLALISSHIESGKTLPQEIIAQLKASKQFQAGMMMVRQLEFALFDFLIHKNFNPTWNTAEIIDFVQKTLDQVRQGIAVIHPPQYNQFQNSFSHIFGGGYAAGYYSYKWAEVLASDAFSLFEEAGIMSAKIGQQLKHHILEQGGSQDALTLFKNFRGREPSPEALLRHNGLT